MGSGVFGLVWQIAIVYWSESYLYLDSDHKLDHEVLSFTKQRNELIFKITYSSLDVGVLALDKFFAPLVLLFDITLLLWRCNEDTRCRSLGLACFSDLLSRFNVDVRNAHLFAEQRQVTEHVDRRNVSCDDAQSVVVKWSNLTPYSFYGLPSRSL